MSFIVVDVESDGPIPAEFSMVCFGAVLFDDHLNTSFYGKTRPISDRFVPEALAISGFSREQHLGFDDPKRVMESFAGWLVRFALVGTAVFAMQIGTHVGNEARCLRIRRGHAFTAGRAARRYSWADFDR